MTLSRLLASSGSFEWHDAVAMVSALAEQAGLDTSNDPSVGIRSVDAIVMTPEGQFESIERGGHVDLVTSLGGLLQRLLEEKPSPANLRLLAWQSTSDAAAVVSFEDFTRELGRWERPGRAAKLLELYKLGRSAPPVEPVMVPAVVEPPPPVEPPPAVEAPAPAAAILAILAPILRRTPTRIELAGIAAVMFIAALGLFARFARSDRPLPAALQVVAESADIELPAEVVRPTVEKRSAARRDSRRANAPAKAGREAGAPVNRPDRTRPLTGTVAAPSANATRLRDAFAGVTKPAETPVASTGRSAPSTSTRMPAPEPARAASAGPFRPGDAGIVEPILVKPYLPNLRTEIPESELGVLEILVDTRGNVETVRLKSPMNRYREKWWLFTAKGWKFEPATRNGQPVRFLKRILLTDLNLSEPQ